MNEEKRKRGEWQMSGREKLNCGQITGMIFRDQEHKEFTSNILKSAAAGCVSSSADLLYWNQRGYTKNIEQIYDLDKGCVKTECLRKGWQTVTA